jgi:tetratricopeptide (TPR) repeat protein
VWKKVKTILICAMFFTIISPGPARSWNWNAGDEGSTTLRDDLEHEMTAYRQQVGNGLSLRDRIIALDRIIGNYKPLGANVTELEAEQSRLMLQEKQQQLRTAQAQNEATLLYEKGVAEYHDGQFQLALTTFREAERLLPQDDAIKEGRRKLEGVSPIVEAELGNGQDSNLIRLAVVRYLENDPKRALNALVYASEKNVDRPEILRLRRLIETNHPEVEAPRINNGTSFVDSKLQKTLEDIYDGRYVSAIAECSDVLDVEPRNVLAMTRLGSAYFAMNEKDKAKNIWIRALQLDPNNLSLKKFLYGQRSPGNAR